MPAPIPTGATSPTPVGCHVDIATGNLIIGDEAEVVYVMDRAGNILSQFSTRPTITDLSAVTFDPCTNTIWVSNDSSNIVAEFDLLGTPTGASFTPSGSVDGDGITYNPVSRTFLMGEDTGDQILEVDRNGTLLNTYPVAPISPEGLALDTVTGTVFVANGLIAPIAVFTLTNIVTGAPANAVNRYGSVCGNVSLGVSDWVRDDGASCAGFQVGYQAAQAPGGLVVFNIGLNRQMIPLAFVNSNCTAYALGDLLGIVVRTSANGRAGFSIPLPPNTSGPRLTFWAADVDLAGGPLIPAASDGLEIIVQ